jgi:hypothetical protein
LGAAILTRAAPPLAGTVGFTGPFLVTLDAGAIFCPDAFFFEGASSPLAESKAEEESDSGSISSASESDSLKSEAESESFFPAFDISFSRPIIKFTSIVR